MDFTPSVSVGIGLFRSESGLQGARVELESGAPVVTAVFESSTDDAKPLYTAGQSLAYESGDPWISTALQLARYSFDLFRFSSLKKLT